MMIRFNIAYNITKECRSTSSTSTFSLTYLSGRTVLQIKNYKSILSVWTEFFSSEHVKLWG